MVTHEIVVSVVVTPGRLRLALLLALALLFPRLCSSGSQDVSVMTFYYPPASGYVDSQVVGGTSYLARYSGNVTFGSSSHPSVFVRAGANGGPDPGYPNVKLRVSAPDPAIRAGVRAMRVNGCIAFPNSSYPNKWRCGF